ncbi:MAG: hypothetical protein GX648_03525 [Crenarchaeota archaeon]|nr:hypothetical protein [Thermoproteota archaeon]
MQRSIDVRHLKQLHGWRVSVRTLLLWAGHASVAIYTVTYWSLRRLKSL